MKYIWDVPPRLQKKEGITGRWKDSEFFTFCGFAIAGLVLFFVFKNISFAFAFVSAVIVIGGSFLYWLMPLKYDTPTHVWIDRMLKFNKSQKVYYFIRNTFPKK